MSLIIIIIIIIIVVLVIISCSIAAMYNIQRESTTAGSATTEGPRDAPC